jgi:hypothetical protein
VSGEGQDRLDEDLLEVFKSILSENVPYRSEIAAGDRTARAREPAKGYQAGSNVEKPRHETAWRESHHPKQQCRCLLRNRGRPIETRRELSEEERRARIRGIPRIIASVTEFETRGDISTDDFVEGFDTEEAERMRKLLNYRPLMQLELMRSLGLSPEGKPISRQGLIGANVDRYRTAFEALRLLNMEYLSRCCARISKITMKSESELKDNAKIIDQAVKSLKRF